MFANTVTDQFKSHEATQVTRETSDISPHKLLKIICYCHTKGFKSYQQSFLH